MRSIFTVFTMLLLAGCSTLEFEETLIIKAPVETVFSTITDYESYDELLPKLHDHVEIVSENRHGAGVVWQSTGTFKGFSNTTTWTVTDYQENQIVVMEGLDDGSGRTVLKTKPIADDQTEYTMYISLETMFKPFEKEFIAIFKEEMAIIKAESERKHR